MSLLTSCNLANPQNAHWVANDGTDAAPVIAGNPVQLCTGGALASSAGNFDSITGSGAPDTSELRLGSTATASGAALLNLGPRLSAGPDIYGGSMYCQLELLSPGNIQVNNDTQIIVNPDGTAVGPGQIAVNANGKIEMAAGSVLDFNGASAQFGVYDQTVVVGAVPNGGPPTAITTPAGIPNGTYAVMLTSGAPGDLANIYNVNAMCSFSAGLITFGGVGSVEQGAGQLRLSPNTARTGLQIENSLGGGVALAGCSVRFVMVVRN